MAGDIKTIKSIIDEFTSWNHGKYHRYLLLSELKLMTQQIKGLDLTANYIRITPFYINAKLEGQIELEDLMIYVECRKNVGDQDKIKHIADCYGKDPKLLSSEEQRNGGILYPLCNYDDGKAFHRALEIYLEYIFECIPNIMRDKIMKLVDFDDLGFGNFCFEIHSQ